MTRSRWSLALSLAAMTAAVQPAAAQKGFRVAVTGGVFGSLTQLSQASPAGLGGEITPEWRTTGGFGIGLGFRYVSYPDRVPDHGSLFLDVKRTAATGSVRPLVGLRAGVFAGGDSGGDDPFIGIVVGPVAGVEIPLAGRSSVQVLGSALGLQGLFRGRRFLPGIQAGFVIR